MASNPRKRVQQDVLKADINAFLALKGIGDYQSINPSHSLSSVATLYEHILATSETEVHAQNALAAARDAAIAAQWEFHEAILGVKNQAKALFGPNSDQVAALGLKKKAERKSPVRVGRAAEARSE